MVDVKEISEDERIAILKLNESYFLDFKGKQVKPAKLSKTISAFANASGGELYIGVEESAGTAGKFHSWDGFQDQEAANHFFQLLNDIDPLGNSISKQFLFAEKASGYLLHLTISKTQGIIKASDGVAYIRSNASSLPLNDDALERLRYDKGIQSYENECVIISLNEVCNSETIIEFLLEAIPTGEPVDWLRKQFVLVGDKPTVAGVLLFSDNPQAVLPKRSAIKILRYQTRADAERDFLASDPETVEGPLYDLIYNAVDRIKEIIEGIEKIARKVWSGFPIQKKLCMNC
ncbi:RNA-binding domain-containing protein [Ochrobactrum sp. 3-3]|uniref:AlbA family DNA-binding domain-containing protein n=1 Tax=Ochrobactrum sp. 3-3 TaxID=1830124 RepID=UPI000DEF686D|nr:RNA-binding domain-containing protein [Ochrobactrum sp. 3-3]